MGDDVDVPRRFARREALLLAGAAVLVACSGDDDELGLDEVEERAATSDTTPPAPPKPSASELETVAGLARAEHGTIALLDAVLRAISEKRLTDVPAVIASLAESARRHHVAHAGALNDVLRGAGAPTVDGPDATAPGEADAIVAGLADADGVEAALVGAHTDIAGTYLSGLDDIDDLGTRQVVTSIRPIELQLAAVVRFLGGEEVVPDALE